MEEEDETPQLPADTLAALQSFYTERDARTQQFESLKSRAEEAFDDQHDGQPLSMDLFSEDWNESQFWYTDDTATTLARQLLDGATNDSRIAVVSAPSVFIQLKNLLASPEYGIKPQITLLEFDERFKVFKEFVHYDFQQPTRLPAEMRGGYDRVVVDPPFLSEDCQTKAALTVRWLAESWDANSGLRIISCTGERMEDLILKLYGMVGVKTTTFMPEHAKGLSNEFRCYANFECGDWKWA